ncbi:MAG TPA: D-Ala-D-Ala carboxypeptidase family metallohydrolase [Gemmatirosa sp.]
MPGVGACTPENPDCHCDASGFCCPQNTFCNVAPAPPPDTTAGRLRILWARGPNAEGSFTTLAGERTLALAAEAAPERLASSVTWSVVADPGDAARGVVSGGPPSPGATSSLDVARQTTERWRLPHGAPLSARALAFRVVAELPASGGRRATRDSIVVRQREVDVLRQEYADFGIAAPAARDVRTAADVAGQTRFAWSQLNQGDYSVAVITPVLVAGLNTLAAQWDEPLSLSSVFRNPAHHRFHISVSGGSAKALLSQHQYGTAVDIRTYRNARTWHRLRNIAKSAGACAEPLDISTSDHVHADWRASAPVCPRGW